MGGGEISKSMEVAGKELHLRILERQVREREQADRDARCIAAHLIFVAVARDGQTGLLELRSHIEAPIAQLIEMPVAAGVVRRELAQEVVDEVLDDQRVPPEMARQC